MTWRSCSPYGRTRRRCTAGCLRKGCARRRLDDGSRSPLNESGARASRPSHSRGVRRTCFGRRHTHHYAKRTAFRTGGRRVNGRGMRSGERWCVPRGLRRAVMRSSEGSRMRQCDRVRNPLRGRTSARAPRFIAASLSRSPLRILPRAMSREMQANRAHRAETSCSTPRGDPRAGPRADDHYVDHQHDHEHDHVDHCDDLEGARHREVPRSGDGVRGHRKRTAREAGEHWTGPRCQLVAAG